MGTGELLWAAGMVLAAVGGGMFAALPQDRRAAALGMAAGVGIALFVAAALGWHMRTGAI